MVLSDMTVLSNCYEIVILIKNVPLHISASHLPKLLQKNAYDSTSRYLNVHDFTVTEGLQTCVDPLQVGDLPNFIRICDKNLIGSETWCNHLGGIWWWSFSWTHIWRHVCYCQPEHSGGCCVKEWHTSSLLRFLFFPVPPRVNSPSLFCVVFPWWWHWPTGLYFQN